jgi:hypothetical protein
MTTFDLPTFEPIDPLMRVDELESVVDEMGELLVSVEEVLDEVSELGGVVEENVAEFVDGLASASESVSERLGEVGDELKEGIAGALVERCAGAVEDVGDEVDGAAGQIFDDTCDSIASWGGSASDEIEERMGELRDEAVAGLKECVEDGVDELRREVVDEVSEELAQGAVLATMQATMSSVLSAFTPQLLLLKAVSEVLRHLLAVFRMFG